MIKNYAVSDEHRLAMLRIFVDEIDDDRVLIDEYFIWNWEGEMITKDVDLYCQKEYGENIIHIFGTDTLESMPTWDGESYAMTKIEKLFVPRTVKEKPTPINNKEDWQRIASEYSILHAEFFCEAHIPDVSSTEIRKIIPEHTDLLHLFSADPKFIIPGLSKKISQYILEHRLYRPKLAQKPKILVHVCCGPDVTMPIIHLRDEYEVICFWYDPNIQPKEEHDKRYEAFVKVCEIEKIPYIKGAYDVKNFFTRIQWLEFTPEKWEKCTNCYDMRMYVSAKLAARLKIPLYTSSLNTSPKKDLEKLFVMGHKYAKKYDITFLDIPFRKRWGFEKSVEYTREHDIFRQNYCGCIYSIREGGESEMKVRMVG
jgi:predicted adenine nucleotide alpha hydrolase (AANH) superfamily ATPase/nicotinic acid mononucleotide adenylyltransferase